MNTLYELYWQRNMFLEYSYYGGSSTGGCRGQCVAIQECKELLSLLKQKPLQPETIAFLRKSQCGFDGRIPKVCCPNSPFVIPRPIPVTTGYRPPVRNNEPQAQRLPSGWESHPNARLIPADQCGVDSSERIWGGNRTDIGQYPWTALFQYQSCK